MELQKNGIHIARARLIVAELWRMFDPLTRKYQIGSFCQQR